MWKNVITPEEAQKVISEFPDKEDYVNTHLQMKMGMDGEADDNSIELAKYWERCKEITEM